MFNILNNLLQQARNGNKISVDGGGLSLVANRVDSAKAQTFIDAMTKWLGARLSKSSTEYLLYAPISRNGNPALVSVKLTSDGVGVKYDIFVCADLVEASLADFERKIDSIS